MTCGDVCNVSLTADGNALPWLAAVQDFKQLYDMPNPYSPAAHSKPDGPRKSAGDARQKQVR